MKPKLTYIRLLVSDFKASFAFYQETLGLTERFCDEASGYGEFDTGTATLALFDRQTMVTALGADVQPSVPEGAQDQATIVISVDNVDQAYQELMAKGVVFVAPSVDRPEWTVRTAHFRDPDGNLIEINCPLKRRT